MSLSYASEPLNHFDSSWLPLLLCLFHIVAQQIMWAVLCSELAWVESWGFETAEPNQAFRFLFGSLEQNWPVAHPLLQAKAPNFQPTPQYPLNTYIIYATLQWLPGCYRDQGPISSCWVITSAKLGCFISLFFLSFVHLFIFGGVLFVCMSSACWHINLQEIGCFTKW